MKNSRQLGYLAPIAKEIFDLWPSVKNRDPAAIISVLDFEGVDPTGVADSITGIQNAIAHMNSLGGGVLFFPPGRYRITSSITMGDGTNAQVSTKDHNITLLGSGNGNHNALDFVMQRGATEIVFDPPAAIDLPVMMLAGPIHSIGVANMTLNCNGKASRGLIVNHVTDSKFDAVVVKDALYAGYLLTTRDGFPTGCAYGASNNMFYHCYNVVPRGTDCQGVHLTSGVSSALSLMGKPDSANNDFIGGVYAYGASANASGFYVHGADNNTFYGCQVIPNASPSFGWSIFFQPWAGDTRFPLENTFFNIGANNPVGGVSGTLGNTIIIHQEGDGSPLPLIPNLNAFSHAGVEVVSGKRVWKVRDIATAFIFSNNQDTTSGSFVPVSGLAATLNNVKPGAKIRITFSGNCGKLVSGEGNFQFYVNTNPIDSSLTSIPSNMAFQNVAMHAVIDWPAGGSVAAGLYFRSSDGQITRVNTGNITLEELY